MNIPTAARKRSIENFSAIKNRKVAHSLLRSIQDLASRGNELAVRGLPNLKLNPTLDDVNCPILESTFSYWLSIRSGEEPPSVRHIDPSQLRAALGWFALVDIIDGGDDFIYRLFGSEIAWRFELDLTGQRVSTFPQPFGQFVLASYRACVAARGPLLAQCAFNDPLADQIRCLLLPWSNDSGAIVRLMAVVSVRDRRVDVPRPSQSRLISPGN